MLCCVAHSYLDIKVVCLPIVRRLPALHCVICLFFVFGTVYYALGYQVITNTWVVQQSLLLKRSVGLETLAGCLASSSCRPCAPCVWHFSGPGWHRLPSFSSRPKPSCGTCCSGRSPIHCGAVMAERQKGHSSPRNWWWQPCRPFWGGLGRAPTAAIASTTAGLVIRDYSRLLGGEPEAHLFVVVQGGGR